MAEKIDFDRLKEKVKKFNFSKLLEDYFLSILSSIEDLYAIAVEARKRGIDPEPNVETFFTWDMAERVERLLSINGLKVEGVSKFIRENRSLSRERLALLAIDKLLEGEFGSFSINELVELGVRLPLAILTEGMTVAPLDGIKKVEIKRRGYTSYISIYYAGPIRSAGGTETGLSVIFADYLRRKLSIDEYRPTRYEVYRLLEEIRLYERFVGSFQYEHPDEKILYCVENLPVEITGVPTDDVEVLSYRDLPGIETNRLRGGALRVINDGLIGKAKKLLKVVEELGLDGWDWLKKLAYDDKNNSKDQKSSYNKKVEDRVLSDLVIGRPVFSISQLKKGFRLKYGREPHIGISSVGVHPAVFPLLDYFIVVGSQLKLNLPGKGGIVVPSLVAWPPLVELKDGSVVEVLSEREAIHIKDKVKRILFLGDIVISIGDFIENNYPLVPQYYDEYWWMAELENVGINIDDPRSVTYEESLNLSMKYNVPLNPWYIPNFRSIEGGQELLSILDKLSDNLVNVKTDSIIFKYTSDVTDILKSLRVPFAIRDTEVIVNNRFFFFLRDLLTLYPKMKSMISKSMNVENILSLVIGVKVILGEETFVTARLGRPEKAKPREMSPPVNVLFPIGNYGGPQRDIIKASEESKIVSIELAVRYCLTCNKYTYELKCSKCGNETIPRFYCSKCKDFRLEEKCRVCGRKTKKTKEWVVNIKSIVDETRKKYRLKIPKRVKGVKKLMNSDGYFEPLVKGFLRSKYGLSVFKDGTCRIDITNAPLHSVSIKQINLSREKAEKLGYHVKDDGTIDLYPQDIIIPKSIADYLIRVCKFLDESLTKIYKLKPVYNVKKREDLIGKLVVGLSPHTSCGIIGRIIGFTDSNVLYASPLWHAAKRRDCDGDQDSIILLLDILLNFSIHYLPSSSGGRMDTPLFISPILHPNEVDTQVHNLDIMQRYPRELYALSQKNGSPKSLSGIVTLLSDKLGSEEAYYRYPSFRSDPLTKLETSTTKYSTLKTMKEKLEHQLRIANLIFDKEGVRLILYSLLENHIFRDIKGNLRAFFKQSYICKKCQKSYRRPPISGKCSFCGGELKQTVSEKSVVKYTRLASRLVKIIDDPYIMSRWDVIDMDLKTSLSIYRDKERTLQDFL